MEAKNFRVGNYYLDREKVWKIQSPQEIAMACKGKPVPLTDKLLERLGLTCISASVTHKRLFKIKDLKVRYPLRNFPLSVSYKGVPIAEVEYVHELQNLFFAITGTELELKADV